MEEFSSALDYMTIIFMGLGLFIFFHFKIHLVIYHFIRIAINGQ